MELTKNIFFNTDKLVANTAVKISYSGKLFQEQSEEVYIHYGFGLNWDNVSNVKMEKTDLGFQAEIVLDDSDSFNFCFNDGNGKWDNNDGQNYSFEIEINDFANSWYIRTQEPNCDYVIELGRRVNKHEGEYIYINSSNDIISPNDHILFENANLGNVLFRDIKTNKLSSKDFGSLRFINDIDKLYGNIYDVYSTLYNDEILNELTNPSSGEFLKK